MTPEKIINTATKPNKPGWPSGFTCLHFASDGSDHSRMRVDFIHSLVQRKADLEARTKGSYNTPWTLANGQGAGDISRALVKAGADTTAINGRQKGAREMAKDCSSSLASSLKRQRVEDTISGRSGRTRQTDAAPSRQIRYRRSLGPKGSQARRRSVGSQPSHQKNAVGSEWNRRSKRPRHR